MRHAGESAVQRRTGVRLAGHGSARVRAEIPEVAARFLESQRMVVIGAEDHEGRVWAAPLTGRPGFVAPSGDRTILVDAVPVAPLAGVFDDEHDIGMLAVEPWTRRRMRVNGRARRDGDHLIVRTEQVYSNCPKYLQKRTIVEDLEPGERTSRSGDRLSEAQREWIRAADTFFVATHAPGLGSDVSHRGGNPGFVEVVDDRRLVWPDYAGNLMYMTLGNLELNPAAGLLFLDWATGDALHLTGRARVDWEPREVPGAQRLVEFDVEHVLEAGGASPLRWAFEEYSRFNPPVGGA
ncbi:pyridoxamine 5'-phosphate oxidase family protein [Microbispora bryophytorum]|uniref:Oxidoreductase n=1 Tax=Microbispora bryophytorum TaxID=1460882 RepID=A0A8H9LC17_9ACTN|nr:pyridoxamine 5'-phosphate oxidase family protein [Microbispora bryophytorum]MBD3136003.1 pyridoxamine 5'-phosphate oxidase family protein [Microbispora bryophytorum]TQS07766.1 oxidoreductase [Microbispora bryophytorum]GGO03936.1 oxidoreductase [Microbispora bryophytorum]